MDKDTRKPPTHVTVNTPGEEEKRTAETPETEERPQGTAEKQGKRPRKKKAPRPDAGRTASPGPAPSGCHRFGNPGLYYGRFGVESFPSGAGKQ